MNSYIAIVWLVALLGVGVQAASVATPGCGGSTSAKDIKLVKPTNPPRECEYHINAYSKYVCQLRIDFAMTLAQPELLESAQTGLKTAECSVDYFEVNGLRLCGEEVWQHIYVPFNASAGVSRIDLLISLANRAGGSSLPTPNWDMVVTQLECPAGASVRELFAPSDEPQARATSFTDGFLVAPPGCLQYFPQTKGVVKSFNYNDGHGVYPSHLNYAICFRRTTQTSALTIRSYFFHVGAESSASTLLTDNSCYRSGSSSVNNADFLMVPQAKLVENNERATYFCGATHNDVVISSNNPGPLLVLFNSDEIYDSNDAGFAFTYTVE
ncbi:uncharacterized protein [Drosophila virilis]|uniref:CUB domain-containing protein n=1 Tax=Drosophila virilis TaxID=7244 RepID=B4LLY9_DROVI|nr:uncharacterized protein LOC6627147 [Drosophila virilis]EDW59909.1 uncharacterized protein Dvir_GJ21196 [Drosophila virilis]